MMCVILLLCIYADGVAAEQIMKGKGSFVFRTIKGNKEIRVWYYKPVAYSKNSKIVFVMHGVKRNGKHYRDAWLQYSQAENFLLIVPEFTQKDFPGSAGYNLGNMFSPSGELNDESLWSYTIIEDLFDRIKVITGSKTLVYSMYGHSAGAQFVSRFVMFKPDFRLKTAVAANAGWYTMPTDEEAFPYGLKGMRADIIRNVSVSFAKNLVVLLGDQDNDENHKYLRKTAEALRQGKHRLARGRSFYNEAESLAKEQKVPFSWKIKVIPGVGHSNSGMSRHAAQILR
jgi:poly(3-hydroxybutyrate) depolymerase